MESDVRVANVKFGGVALTRAKDCAVELSVLAKFIHAWAISKGWWENEDRPFAEQVANFHAELSEAWEEFRVHGMDPEKFLYFKENAENPDCPKPEGIAVELADCLVRILDTCGRYNIPIAEAFRRKLEYNVTRPYRHGGKKA